MLGRKDVAVPHTTVILRTFDVSYVRVESVDDEDSEAKSENADDSAEMDLSDSLAEEEDLNELNARGEGEKEKKEQKEREGDAVKSDSAARPPPRSVPPPPPPPTAEATAESAAEVLPVAKRSRVSRWDTPKTSSELDIAAATMVLPGPLPPHPTPPPPPPVRPPSLLAAAAATSVIEDRNRSQHADDCAPTSSATAPVEAVAAEHDPLATDTAAAEPEVEVIVLKGVRSDHLRLLCDEEGNVLGAHGEIVSTALSRGGEAPPVEVVASTGN